MPVAVEEQVKPRRRIGFDLINRRTHLYAGLFFIPWFFIYGASSAVFNHPKWFDSGPMQWSTFVNREYDAGPLPDNSGLRSVGAKLLQNIGLTGQFVVRRDPAGNLQVEQNRFLSNVQLIYDPTAHHLTARRSVSPRWPNLLTRLHTRAGFERSGFLENLWSVIVDIIQVAIFIWIATGLYMWWHLKRFRNWGWLALGSGIALFTVFVLGL
jgi:hypothetical protein